MSSIQIGSIVCLLLIVGYTLRNLNIALLVKHKHIQHIIFGATAAVFVLWIFRAGIYDGLDVHFLWLSALALTLGLRWAIISAVVALLGATLLGFESWQLVGINGLLGVVAPLLFSYAVYTLVFHKLPRHLFVYIFLCAFLPGAASIALKMALLGCYYSIDGIYEWRVVYDNYLLLTPLMLFPEAMLNGITITLLTIYKPEWIYTFHDKDYIDK